MFLEPISKSLDQVMIDITVKQMLNPENPDFYIGTLTLDKVKALFVEMGDPSTDLISIFWKSFAIAKEKYLASKECTLAKLKSLRKYYVEEPGCPACGNTLGYVPGVRCPNCDAEF